MRKSLSRSQRPQETEHPQPRGSVWNRAAFLCRLILNEQKSGCSSRSLREEGERISLFHHFNGRVRGSRVAPRGFYSFASLSPQTHSRLPLPSPLFVQSLSGAIFHAPLTAVCFPGLAAS